MFTGGQYYTLIAGLKEYAPGYAEKEFDADAVYGEIRRELSRPDRRAAGLLWSLMDIYGLSRERIEELYHLCGASGSRWLRDWALFDRNLRNVIAAGTARAKGRSVADSLLNIEGDEIPLTLAKSTAADFNLRGELDYIDKLLAALADGRNADGGFGGSNNFVENERTIDMIRWEKANALAEGHAFGLPVILAYLAKVAIIGRWAALDPVVGREMYDMLLRDLNLQL